MRRIAVMTGAAGLVGILLVSGCSSGHSKASSGGLGQSASKPNGSFDASGADVASGGGALGAPATPNAKAASPESQKQAPLSAAALIMTAQLTVQVGDVAAKADQARDIATDAGGSVVGDDRTSGKNPNATLTLKVPPAQLPDVMGSLSGLGKEQSRHQSTQDVTTEVADVNSRVKSAQASIDRLITLYSSATKVGDIIVLERELNQREADLESLEAQQHALQSQTTMATVTLRLITKAVAPPPAKHHRSGFLGGLARGWHGFTASSVAVLTGVGVLLPFVVLLLVIGAAAVVIRRRWPRSLPEPSTGDPA